MKRNKSILILLSFIFLVNVSCKNKKEKEIEYTSKQGYVNSIDVFFDYNRNKKIDITISILLDKNKHRKVKLKNSNFICQIGDPIVVMINPNDSSDIWIMSKHIIEKENLKEFLIKNQLKLSPFFEGRLN